MDAHVRPGVSRKSSDMLHPHVYNRQHTFTVEMKIRQSHLPTTKSYILPRIHVQPVLFLMTFIPKTPFVRIYDGIIRPMVNH